MFDTKEAVAAGKIPWVFCFGTLKIFDCEAYSPLILLVSYFGVKVIASVSWQYGSIQWIS